MMKKNSFKQKFNKFVIMGLILTESILISCERCNNNNDNNKGENMASQLIEKNQKELSKITYSKTQQERNVTLNENYAKIPNTNLSAKINGNEIHIKDGERTYKLENSKNLSHIFEHDGKIYLSGIKNNHLELEEYNKKIEKSNSLSFELIPNEKLSSDTISVKNNELILEGKKENNKPYKLNINLDRLENLKEIYGN